MLPRRGSVPNQNGMTAQHDALAAQRRTVVDARGAGFPLPLGSPSTTLGLLDAKAAGSPERDRRATQCSASNPYATVS
jgi:hypothetical protein